MSSMRMFTLALATVALNVPAAMAENSSESDVKAIESLLLPNQYLADQLTTQSIAEVMLKDNIAGVSMAFIDHGEIKWQRTYGYADLNTLQPVTPTTVFAGASLSKPLAAVTAMTWVEKGKISLDGDINEYLKSWQLPDSEFTETQKVTLRHLIGHQAGVNNHVPRPYGVDETLPTVTQMLAGEAPYEGPPASLFTTPGERYQYSNPGYTIIQQLIEDVSGVRFEAAVQDAIFKPLGLSSSSFEQPIPEALMARRASGYTEQLSAYPYQLYPFKGAGGVWTTPTDLAHFVMTLIEDYHTGQDTLISQELAADMFARTPVRLGFKKHYVDGSDDIVFDHWGSIPGFTSYLVGSVEHQQALVIMTNSDNGFNLMAAIARTVAQHYGWQPTKPKVFQRVALAPEKLDAFVGEFGRPDGNEPQHAFQVRSEALHVAVDEEWAPLVAIGERTFIDPASNTTFQFLTDKAGEVRWLRVTLESGYNYDQPKQQSLADFIQQQLDESQVEGLAVALIRDGKVTFNQSFGVANVDTGTKITSETLFEAASLAKPVFAYLVLQQAALGVIDLDVPVHTYWSHPDLKPSPWNEQITARMLLTHTAGLPNWRSDTGGELRLLFEPGTDFQYSGEGYEYLRGVLQHELGLDDDGLQALVDQQITEVIDADWMQYTWHDAFLQRKAFGHRNDEVTDNHKHDNNFGAAYSLTTTAGDYAKFAAALMRDDTPLHADASRQMFALQKTLPTEVGQLHRALGFAVKQTSTGRLRYYHSGDSGDFRTYVHLYPDTNDGLVIFSNSDKLFASGLARSILEFLGNEWL
ncbi:hypothetical protein C9928_00730 [Pseudidiomarina aestuarii]|uniref:Beta-lactamase-related domain-containing protein n=1 Tax=Pseudidiomarina aestuarii TaxID=624146 RepID=A0A2T4D0D9_9GAMM|nr:hypothetical protein C9939_01920 [Pseudidiomarina aestuarii]PTB90277.1 hypothetical protein C9928_00730 [Pseudidiomarina aestuarii]